MLSKKKFFLIISLFIIFTGLIIFYVTIPNKNKICISNCEGKLCGDEDGCKGYCQSCQYNKICINNKCETPIPIECIPNCEDKLCGQEDGCKGYCQSCQYNKICINNKCKTPIKESGVMLFDIDGTWTEFNKKDQKKVVDLCIRNNYSIGINTAGGPTYQPKTCENSKKRPMGDDLCKYMSEKNYITFNNVNIGLVNGKIINNIITEEGDIITPYQDVDYICEDNPNLNKDGCRKGKALENTMKKLGAKYGVLVDNDPEVVEGCREYIKYKKMNATVIWAGTVIQYPTTPQLTYETIYNYFKNR
jgi:hypothetical protein